MDELQARERDSSAAYAAAPAGVWHVLRHLEGGSEHFQLYRVNLGYKQIFLVTHAVSLCPTKRNAASDFERCPAGAQAGSMRYTKTFRTLG